MLRLNVWNVMKLRGIESPYSFLRRNGFSQRVAENLTSSDVSSIKLAHIEKLCLLLVCEPHDLLAWYPDKNCIYAQDNPLEKLRKTGEEDIEQKISKIPYRKLKEVLEERFRNE